MLIGVVTITTPAQAEELRPSVSLDVSAARRSVQQRAIMAYSQPQQLIACTKQGCAPILPGCRIIPERGLGGRRSSWDMVICPSR